MAVNPAHRPSIDDVLQMPQVRTPPNLSKSILSTLLGRKNDFAVRDQKMPRGRKFLTAWVFSVWRVHGQKMPKPA